MGNLQFMIAEREAGIRQAIELMADPLSRLPAPIRWAAWLTGTTDPLQAFARTLMQRRVARLQRECQACYQLEREILRDH